MKVVHQPDSGRAIPARRTLSPEPVDTSLNDAASAPATGFTTSAIRRRLTETEHGYKDPHIPVQRGENARLESCVHTRHAASRRSYRSGLWSPPGRLSVGPVAQSLDHVVVRVLAEEVDGPVGHEDVSSTYMP